MKKTILQILPSLNNSGGGVERGTLDVAKEIAMKGYDSVILSAGGSMAEKHKHKGVKNVYLPLDKKNPYAYVKIRYGITKIIKNLRPDIIHVRSRWPAFCLNTIIRKFRIPLITTYHGTYNGNRNFLKKRYNKVMVDGDRVIAISEHILEQISIYFPSAIEKTTLINRGIDTNYFNPKRISIKRKENAMLDLNIPENKHIILLPGRLTSWKGHEIAIDAAKNIKVLMPDLNFAMIFVGSHQNRENYLGRLKQKIKKDNLDNEVFFTGPKLDMPAIYNLADVVLSTSIDPEAFGRVSAEASAMCKPIIASDHGGSKYTIINNVTGWLVEPGNAYDLSKKITEVIQKKQEFKDSVGKKARERIKNYFNIKTMLDKTISLYENTLSEKKYSNN